MTIEVIFVFVNYLKMLQGLQNLGNTCSINTLIQCIGHCDHLRNWLLSYEQNKEHEKREECEGKRGKISICEELARITREMWVDGLSLAPIRFIKALFFCIGNNMRHGEQLDILELWMLLVDKINNEIGKKENCASVQGGNDTEGFMKAWNSHNQICISSWLKSLQGWMITKVKCKACDKTANMYEPFCCLGLDVHSNNGNMEKMFDTLFTMEDILERSCDFCNTRAAGKKSSNICMYPTVLVVYFKRFETIANGATKKLTDAIDIPLHIRFGGLEETYHLCSIGNHIGSLDGGHYYATAKNPDGKWYIYDDINITQIEDISIITKNNNNAYMLFYELNKSLHNE